ncbi:uncharacterized protein CLAFUR5_13982 [Fulvia fulva]|uniref:DUF7918 domain-containing protein n=1 Tax=Passalora fulva TaxID=5499 RepID=A0A9Q8PL31_PASFU|nr:uncharacterized protein CLAFUR5_13982 [Fulvia fulva]KAK4611347.1 hypothetical protein CLAFUR0_14155 [Fulvia fulva]UJO24392.1 hypothetical protein CLAFUR5_13982 [Fulvia fulva]
MQMQDHFAQVDMPTIQGITVDIAISDTVLPAYADPNPDLEPDTTSSYIEAVSNRWFAVLVRIPHDHKPSGNLFIIMVFLDGRAIAEARRRPGEQLPSTPQPEGEAGFEGDILPTFEPGLAGDLCDLEEEGQARDDSEEWLLQGYISGESLRFPHVVTDNNKHEAGDAAEWESKEIAVQFSEALILEAESEDDFGNYVPAKIKTVGNVFAFTFKYRPRQILETILGHTAQQSPDSDKTIRPHKGKGRANSLDSDAEVPTPTTTTTHRNGRKPIWNSNMQCIDWLTETEYAQRMTDPRRAHPADEEWRKNLNYFNSKWMYCCKQMKQDSKFTWCDNADCVIGVFHFWCVGLTREPHWGLNTWLCPICRDLPEEGIRMRDGGKGERSVEQME